MRARNTRRRPGNVVVAVAGSLVTLLACVSLSVDGGMLQDRRRNVQAAADAAALAAAGDLYYNWSVEKGADTGGTARALALETAKTNGYENGVDGTTVDVSIPPATGPFTGQKGYVEVVIKYEHARYFSKVIGTGSIPIRARAVGRGRKATTKQAILVLDPNDKDALGIGGGGTVTVLNSSIQVNSSDPEATIANGGGTMYSEIDTSITGGFVTPGGGSFSGGPLYTGTEPIPDPLAFVPAPNIADYQVRSTKKLSYSQAETITIMPGVYYGGISIQGQANIVMLPGIYYMYGGGFNFSGQGSLTGNGVMIYNDPQSTSDVISISGTNAVNITLSPPTSGPYQGFLFWQARGTTPPIDITGNGNLQLTGTFYATGAQLNVTGNGAADLVGSQYIVDRLKTNGNGNFTVDWTPYSTPGVREVALVE
ncbi:MAG TPA: pilus assembly protein TadG-related protein [Fimbriiglobus sp.]|nr:pilus assembly protein TadG-related protein [Fimbriiglobus sp.]